MPFTFTLQGDRHRAELLRLIREHHASKGYAPTVRDLADALGLAAPTVQTHLNRMRGWGWVTWELGMSRTLRVTDAAPWTPRPK